MIGCQPGSQRPYELSRVQGADDGGLKGQVVRYPLLLRELNGSSPASAEMQIYTHPRHPPYQQLEDAQSANAPAEPSQGHRGHPALLLASERPRPVVAAHIRLSRAGPLARLPAHEDRIGDGWWSWVSDSTDLSKPSNQQSLCVLALLPIEAGRTTDRIRVPLLALPHCNLSLGVHMGRGSTLRTMNDAPTTSIHPSV